MFDCDFFTDPGGRSVNEDCLGTRTSNGITCWVVGDGLGGQGNGRIASHRAVDAVLDAFSANPSLEASAVQSYIAAAHSTLLALQNADQTIAGAQSTLVILLSDGWKAIWGNAGDSRLYHFRRGTVLSRTRDHSMSQFKVDDGRMSENGIRTDPDRNRVIESAGKSGVLNPTTLRDPVELRQGDSFLLCVDGFWGPVFETEMEIDWAKSLTASEWMTNMRRRLDTRFSEDADNITAYAIKVVNPELSEPESEVPIALAPAPQSKAPPPPAPKPRVVTSPWKLGAAGLAVALLLAVSGWAYWKYGNIVLHHVLRPKNNLPPPVVVTLPSGPVGAPATSGPGRIVHPAGETGKQHVVVPPVAPPVAPPVVPPVVPPVAPPVAPPDIPAAEAGATHTAGPAATSGSSGASGPKAGTEKACSFIHLDLNGTYYDLTFTLTDHKVTRRESEALKGLDDHMVTAEVDTVTLNDKTGIITVTTNQASMNGKYALTKQKLSQDQVKCISQFNKTLKGKAKSTKKK